MSLSVLIPTREPAGRVAAVVAPLRAVVDEVVIAVDHRVDEGQLGAYERLADRLLRFEFTGADRALAWLHRQCSGDWVLLLAGDEVVSQELVRELPSLCAKPQIRQYWFPTRWVWPDGARWLDELPWWPDFHNRLVRNDERLWFDGGMHTGARPQTPMRYVAAPLYHLALAIYDVAHREERVRRYEAEHPGRTAHGGGSLNERFYLPERSAHRPPVPIPDEDRPWVAAVLAGNDPDAPPGPATKSVPLGRQREIEAVWARRPLDPTAYRASLEPFERDHRLAPDERRPLFVCVRNDGTAVWPGGGDEPPEIRLSYHWRDAAGAMLVHDGERSHFPAPVAPGETAILPAVVTSPGGPGEYELVLDLVHEHVRWFGCERTLTIRVQEPAA